MGFCGYCVSLHPQFPTKALLTFSAFFLLSLAKVLNLPTPLTVSVEALLWRLGNGIVRLGDLAGGTFNSVALGVSRDGAIVVGRGTSNRGEEAFIWDDFNQMRNLRNVLIDLGLDLTRWQLEQATGISADGSIIIGSGSNPQGETVAWVANISSPSFLGLGGLGGSERISSRAYAISDDGSTVVGESESANGIEAFRWTATQGITGLGDLAGGEFESIANAVSADGQVVVGYGQSDKGREAFRWTPGEGMVALGDLPSGDFESEALAVSANGATIIGYGTDGNGTTAFIWDAANGMRNLTDVLGNLNISLEGWFLEQATEISPDGQTIIGLGRSPQGRDQAWQVTLNPGSKVQGVDPSSNSANEALDLSPSGSVVVGQSFTIINNPPQVTQPIGDQTNTSNLTYRYQIPDNIFTDTGDRLTYRVTLANGNALPPWLQFDPLTRTLAGTPTAADLGTLNLEVIATDTSNVSY
jgi:probable HAF family extracellular repeat protein